MWHSCSRCFSFLRKTLARRSSQHYQYISLQLLNPTTSPSKFPWNSHKVFWEDNITFTLLQNISVTFNIHRMLFTKLTKLKCSITLLTFWQVCMFQVCKPKLPNSCKLTVKQSYRLCQKSLPIYYPVHYIYTIHPPLCLLSV